MINNIRGVLNLLLLSVLTLTIHTVIAQSIVKTVSGNYPRDLFGQLDTRMSGQSCGSGPCIWGYSDSSTLTITFKPPVGYSVHITALKGDLIAWIKSLPGDPTTPLESSAGVLLGFQNTADTDSIDCDLCTNGTPLYIQGVVTDKQPGARMPFDYNGLDFVLADDNILNIKLASFLSTVRKPIHSEATYTISYKFVANN